MNYYLVSVNINSIDVSCRCLDSEKSILLCVCYSLLISTGWIVRTREAPTPYRRSEANHNLEILDLDDAQIAS
jgi:hypothetical protein